VRPVWDKRGGGEHKSQSDKLPEESFFLLCLQRGYAESAYEKAQTYCAA